MDPTSPTGFGDLLRTYRLAAGLTQEELAERARLSANAISDLERGARQRPWRDTVQLLAAALHLDPADRSLLEAAARAPRPLAAPGPPKLTERPEGGVAPAGFPTGTVTFLFTDVEGSTRLWEQYPAEMRLAAVRHDALVAEHVARHHGLVVRPRGEGDSRFAVFARASDAVAAAVALQQALTSEAWSTPAPLRVRVALHTGEAELRDGDYYGPAVNRCARLRAIAHGGQVLVSQTTHELVRGALPADVSLRDLGEQRLADLTVPERVFQILHPGLRAEFPALRSLDSYPNNLPAQLTTFVGREREISDVIRGLADTRLLTLTGAGGCGKTRLALQVAGSVVPSYPDGVWLVELAPLAEPTLVGQTVASVLDVRGPANRPIDAVLVEALRTRRPLLILDNCEHLVDACARLADTVLRGCPNVRILATSREALGIAGEVSWRVPSLVVPTGDVALLVDELARNECVRLLTERARAALPGFTLTSQNGPALAQICRRLDGIPLAIELAAARLKGLSADQIVSRLDQRFRLLTGGSRAALPRQQTLAAMVGWSYDLLNERERTLFNRLAVFVGGFALEAAEDVCGEAEFDVLDLLLRLVEKSLVVAEPSDDGADRYRLLETLRQFALEKLAASGEAEGIRARHAAHYLALAERAGTEFWSPRFTFWYTRLRHELNNLRAALRWTVDAGDVERALRVCGALSFILYLVGQPIESRQWLAELLASPAAASPTVGRARALQAAAQLAWGQLELVEAEALADEALEIARARGDQDGIAQALTVKALVAVERGDYAGARGLAEEAVTAEQAAGVPTYRHSAGALWETSYYLADYPRARAYLEGAIALATTLGSPFVSNCLDWLGHVATASGDYATARSRYVESMRLRLTIDRKIGVAFTLSGFAGLAAAQGDLPRAVRLSSAASRICELWGAPSHRTQEGYIRDRLPAIRAALGDAAYDAAWAEGRAMTQEQAVGDALAAE